MLFCLKQIPVRVIVCRHSRIFKTTRTFSDKISNAYNRSLQRQGQASKDGTGYMTRARFEEQQKSQRVQSADADHGVMPTEWQKFCLVLTRMYHRKSDIPQYVRGGTMNRMHDRMRIVFIAVAVVCFYVFFFYIESQTATKISRDRDAALSGK